MTTIAYRDGIMAADTASWDVNGVYFGRARKLHRLADGRVFGGAGSTSAILRVVAWLNGAEDKPALDDDKPTDVVQAIIATPGPGRVVVYVDVSLMEVEQHPGEFVAIGSGRELALGAMAMGASAAEAVRVATDFDRGSRPPVDTIVV